MPDDTRKLVWKADELPAQERAVMQRLNPNSHLLRTGLSRLAGLQRAHVSLGRIPPGKDSFAYHSHMVEEEWVYILSGRGIAEIDGKQYEVGPGDFMGFPTPGIAHLLRNPPRDELPCAVPNPSHSMTLRVHCPSNAVVFITTVP